MADGFRAKLAAAQGVTGSLLCVGWDPLADKLPDIVRKTHPTFKTALFVWWRELIDATAPYACMFKPQHAHWEALDALDVLRLLIAYSHEKYPHIPVLMDCKRGDIDRTQQRYGEAHLLLEGADGMNYNGYMGKDTIEKLIDPDNPGKAIVSLGRTSNPSAWEVQDEPMADGRPLWEFMVRLHIKWATELGILGDAGVVMGAAYKDPGGSAKPYVKHLTAFRQIVGDSVWCLAPGVGTQGGFAEETVYHCYVGPGSVAINSSSGATMLTREADFADKAADACADLKSLFGMAVQNLGYR